MNLALTWLVLLGAIVLVLLPVWAATLVWVYRDAEKLGKPGIVVALLIGLLCWPAGLLVWLILRADYMKAKVPAPPLVCPRCGRALSSETAHGLCPACLLQQATASESGAPNPSTFTPPSVAELAPLFPQLEIVELLGRGGMGAVYKARQPGLDRFVALKILPATTGSDPTFAERFQREARALAALNHPHIVAVYDFGQMPTLSYFVMEYVDGVNLRQLERTARLSPREALAIVPQVCEALQFAHDRGIVHRDIKPENILVDKQGRVKIADFGLAKLLRVEPGGFALTETRHAVGTPQYMAPEQVEKPQSVDHRADIYSLGVVFYEMLTGELPLGRFPVPSQRVQVDVRLDEVVLKALEKEPDRRYQQASAFKTKVETYATAPDQPAPVPPPVVASAPLSSSPALSPGQRVGRFGARVLFAVAALVFLWPVIGLVMDFDDRGHVLRFAVCWVIAGGLALLCRGVFLLSSPTGVPPVAPPGATNRAGSWLAFIGCACIASAVLSLVGAIIRLNQAYEQHSQISGAVKAAGLAQAIKVAMVPATLGGVLALLGLTLISIALLRYRYRAQWFFWAVCVTAVCALPAVPVGTLIGVLLLVYVTKRRAEFLNNRPNAPSASPPPVAALPVTPTAAVGAAGSPKKSYWWVWVLLAVILIPLFLAFAVPMAVKLSKPRPLSSETIQVPLVLNFEVHRGATNHLASLHIAPGQRAFTDIVRLPQKTFTVAGAIWPDRGGSYTLELELRNYPDDSSVVHFRGVVHEGVPFWVGALGENEFRVTLNRDGQAAAQPVTPPMASWLMERAKEYGPVWVEVCTPTELAALKLADGSLQRERTQGTYNDKDVWNFMVRTGADLRVHRQDGAWWLLMRDGRLTQVVDTNWDKPNKSVIAAALAANNDAGMLMESCHAYRLTGGLPTTYAFFTSEGGLGVLQVQGQQTGGPTDRQGKLSIAVKTFRPR